MRILSMDIGKRIYVPLQRRYCMMKNVDSPRNWLAWSAKEIINPQDNNLEKFISSS